MTHNSYLFGNAFEAIIGAIYLDRGYDYCMRFIGQRIMSRLINIDKLAYKEVNFKSKLIEWGQKKAGGNRIQPARRSTGRQQLARLHVASHHRGHPVQQRQGLLKKESQQLAAKATLNQLRKSSQLVNNILSKRDAKEEAAETVLQRNGVPGCNNATAGMPLPPRRPRRDTAYLNNIQRLDRKGRNRTTCGKTAKKSHTDERWSKYNPLKSV